MIDLTTLFICILHISLFYSLVYLIFWAGRKTHPGFGCWTLATISYSCIFGSALLRLVASKGFCIGAFAFFIPLASALYTDGILRFIKDKKLPLYSYLGVLFSVVMNLCFYFIYDSLAMRSAVLVVSVAPFVFIMCNTLFLYTPRTGRVLYWLGGALFVMRFVGLVFTSVVLFIRKGYNDVFQSSDMGAGLLFTLIAVLGVGLFFLLIHSHRSQEELYEALMEEKRKNQALSSFSPSENPNP